MDSLAFIPFRPHEKVAFGIPRLPRRPDEVRAKNSSLTQPGDQRKNGDFRTTTKGRAGGLLARTGSLSGHPSKQQPRSTLLDPIFLR
ncbi:hypothetical protein J6590_103806 [Homalodisca vitripennis]|nr:hypothetical protein J6590_103806 [Homalodisca vitripennis]